jgi:hypothetical protein
VTSFASADHRTRPHVERREQVERAMAAVIVRAPLGL